MVYYSCVLLRSRKDGPFYPTVKAPSMAIVGLQPGKSFLVFLLALPAKIREKRKFNGD